MFTPSSSVICIHLSSWPFGSSWTPESPLTLAQMHFPKVKSYQVYLILSAGLDQRSVWLQHLHVGGKIKDCVLCLVSDLDRFCRSHAPVCKENFWKHILIFFSSTMQEGPLHRLFQHHHTRIHAEPTTWHQLASLKLQRFQRSPRLELWWDRGDHMARSRSSADSIPFKASTERNQHLWQPFA